MNMCARECVCIRVGSFGKFVLCVLNDRVELFLCINISKFAKTRSIT